MSKPDYFVEIHTAQTAAALHTLRQQAEADGDLTKSEVTRIVEAIGKKFSRMNHEAVGHQQPRWTSRGAATAHPIRIPTTQRAR